jgi:hypothetical protein
MTDFDPPPADREAPFADHNSRAAIDDAVACLTADRAPEWAGDIAVEIHVLASLGQELELYLRHAVARARGAGYRWHQIAELLGLTTEHARRLYEPHNETKSQEKAYRPKTSYHSR